MKTLQSTTDFVLANCYHNSDVYLHAKTLKLKPELWMFVPTDENGNVLEQCNEICACECDKIKEYRTALSKVWFKGFEWNTAEFCDEPMLELENKDGKYFLYDCVDKNFQDSEDNFISILEDLIPYNLEITENFGKNLLL